MGACVSTQSGGQSPRYKIKNINLFLTKYSCLGILYIQNNLLNILNGFIIIFVFLINEISKMFLIIYIVIIYTKSTIKKFNIICKNN